MRRASTRSIRRAASTPPSPDATKKLAVAPLVSPTGNPRSPAKSKDHYTRHSEGTGLAAPRSASPLTSGGVGTTGPRNGPFFGWRGIGFRRGDRRFDRRGMQHCAANLPLQEKRKLARAGLGELSPTAVRRRRVCPFTSGPCILKSPSSSRKASQISIYPIPPCSACSRKTSWPAGLGHAGGRGC
jgi:hypothetical protein